MKGGNRGVSVFYPSISGRKGGKGIQSYYLSRTFQGPGEKQNSRTSGNPVLPEKNSIQFFHTSWEYGKGRKWINSQHVIIWYKQEMVQIIQSKIIKWKNIPIHNAWTSKNWYEDDKNDIPWYRC